MAGLLDLFAGEDRGLLGLMLLQAAAPKAGGRTGLGEGLLGAFQGLEQRKAAQQDRAMRQQQFGLQQQQLQLALQQAQRQAAREKTLEDLPAQFMKPGQMPPSMDARDIGQPGEQQIPAQQFDMAGYANAMFRYDPRTAMALQQSMRKDTTPIKLSKGEKAYSPDGRLLFGNEAAPDLTSGMQEYQFAKSQGYRGTFEEWKKSNAKAGASSVVVNAEKPFINALGEGLGKQIDGSLAQAKAAQGTISTAQNIMRALDSGKVISGPGATWRVAGLQLGQVLGVGGKDSAEVLSNTRSVIQSMAQAELDAAMQMRGQGQITEAERDIIRRAASGNIDSLTSGEIRLLAGVMDRSARSKIAAHSRNVNSLRQMPNAAPLLPFYSVDEPPQYGTQTNGVRRYNPTTGRIE